MKYTLAATAVIIALSGCASTPPAENTASSGAASRAPVASAKTPRAATSSGAGNAANANRANVAAAPSKRSVYFDYDSNTVKDEYAPVVQSNARYLAQQHSTRVTIQGNTDERGSREYNLALGQRRADAVKERLTLLGVPAQQIETVSFGEEKPKVEDENEQAFAENRRADIVYAR